MNRNRPRSPARSLSVLVAVAVGAMLVGILVGHEIRSPAQQALDTQAPGKAVITASVTTHPSSSQVPTRGTITIGRAVSVGPVTASTPISVVTRVFIKPGERVKTGRPLIEVSGRPVFLLRGRFRAYRDLEVGASGPDAAQVNHALAALNLPAPGGDVFTAGSLVALGDLYQRFGYAAPHGLDLREVVFVPTSTAQITSVKARVGGPATVANLVSMSSGATVVTADLERGAANSLRVGESARIFLDGSGGQLAGTITSKVPEGSDTTTVTLKPHKRIAESRNGADVRVVFTEHSADTSAFNVPVSAVYSDATGQPSVVMLLANGAEAVVPVRVGAVVGGSIGVSPVPGDSRLKEGDKVVVSGPGLN